MTKTLTGLSLLDNALDQVPDSPGWCVALSGGMDSSLLLHRASKIARDRKIPLRAIHVNHDLSPNAKEWELFCRQSCHTLGVDLYCEQVAVPDQGNLEDEARKARYRVFEAQLRENEILLLAHHARDQVETFLMRVLRGTALHGVTGMPVSRPLGLGVIYRPWLKVDFGTLQNSAEAMGLQFIEDESNQDARFDRNYLRHKTLSTLADRWVDYEDRFARTMASLEKTQDLLNEYLDQDLSSCTINTPYYSSLISVDALSRLSRPRQKSVLQHWVSQLGAPGVPNRILERVFEEVIPASDPATAKIVWSHWEMRHYRGRLYALDAKRKANQPTDLPLSSLLDGANFSMGSKAFAFEQTATAHHSDVISVEDLSGAHVFSGLNSSPENEASSGTAARRRSLLKDGGVPPWDRENWPFITIGEMTFMLSNQTVLALSSGEGEISHYALNPV